MQSTSQGNEEEEVISFISGDTRDTASVCVRVSGNHEARHRRLHVKIAVKGTDVGNRIEHAILFSSPNLMTSECAEEFFVLLESPFSSSVERKSS